MAASDLIDLRRLALGNPGPMRDRLNALVMSEQKTATAALWEIYADESEPLESEREQLWLLDSNEEPIALLEVTRVDVCALHQIQQDFVLAEGEGHPDVASWEGDQRAYWSATAEPEMQASGYPSWRVNKNTLIVCIWFKLINRDSDSVASL